MIQAKSRLKLTWFAFIMVVASGACLAQNTQEPIEIPSDKNNVYLRNGRSLETDDLKAIMGSNPQAMSYMKKAAVNTGFATVLSITGGVLAGIPVGRAIRGTDANWALAGVGVGLFLLTIPLEIGHNKNVRAAVDTYNNGLEQLSSQLQFKVGLSPTGFGFQMKF